MTIIIGAGPEPAAPNPLPTVDPDLPHPASVPAGHFMIDEARITELLTHDHPLVRDFAVEQVARRPDPKLLEALTARIQDEDDSVAVEAIAVLDRERFAPAADAMLAAFASANSARTVALAGALATIAPTRLLEAVQARGRLDHQSYGAVASALAITATEPVRVFLDKALNRSGALNPERKGALYTAVMLSGEPALTTRVLTKAVDDSKQEEPKDASFPSRAAMGTLAGLPLAATRSEAGPDLLKHTRTLLERDVRPALEDADATALTEALSNEQPAAIVAALRPVIDLTEALTEPPPASAGDDDRHRSVARRRRGLLIAMVDRAGDLEALEPAKAALFAAVAARAAGAALSGQLDEAGSEGLIALAKALEVDDRPELAKASDEQWTERFAAKSARDIRRVVTIVVRESFRRSETVQRLTRALMASGHGRALLDALGEIQEDTGIHELVVTAMNDRVEDAESVVVDILTETPLPEEVVPLALMLGALVRTERIGVAIGRRYYDLRTKARRLVAQTALRVADPRLLPLMETRAFRDEPEELAWIILGLVHDQPREGRFAEALERIDAEAQGPGDDEDRDYDDRPQLEVSLECEMCGETLAYRFERAYVDPEAKDELGDPAFVGEMVCKACGTPDRLKPTPETASILTQHMLAFLQTAQQGVPPQQPPLVSPARTTVGGKSMGLGAALRALDEEVQERPQSIRTRLHRARTRMILKRPGVEEDLAAVKEVDPDAVEADALMATLAMRDRQHDRAAELVIGAVKRLKQEPEPRLYDVEDVDELRTSLESYLLELSELGATVPADIDLSRARRVRERHIEALQAEQEAALAQREAQREAAAEPSSSRSGRKKSRRRRDKDRS